MSRVFACAAVIVLFSACGEAPPTGETSSDERGCIGPRCCIAGQRCCTGSICNTYLSQHAECVANNYCEACGKIGQTPCGGQDCYGTSVLNGSGSCAACSSVVPSFNVNLTEPTSGTVDFRLSLAALGQLSVIDVATGAVVQGWYQVFDVDNTIFLALLQPSTTYRIQFTPTASVTSTGGCATTYGPTFTTPSDCTVGAACNSACSECNDGTCQCAGTITSCSPYGVCSNPNQCANHGGVNPSLGCQQS